MVSSRYVSSCCIIGFALIFDGGAIEIVLRNASPSALVPLVIAIILFIAFFQARKNSPEEESSENEGLDIPDELQ